MFNFFNGRLRLLYKRKRKRKRKHEKVQRIWVEDGVDSSFLYLCGDCQRIFYISSSSLILEEGCPNCSKKDWRYLWDWIRTEGEQQKRLEERRIVSRKWR